MQTKELQNIYLSGLKILDKNTENEISDLKAKNKALEEQFQMAMASACTLADDRSALLDALEECKPILSTETEWHESKIKMKQKIEALITKYRG